MKFTWFNLMPWPLPAGRFPARRTARSGSTSTSRCTIPARGHEVYNTYLDLLEYAEHARLRRHRRQRAPRKRLRPDAVAQHHGRGLARRTSRRRWSCWATPSRSTIRRSAWPRNSRCSTCISGGRLVAGFPVGTSMDTNYCLRPDPGADAREVRRGARSDPQGLGEPTSRSPSTAATPSCATSNLAEADPEAAPAGPHPRRRLGRDLRFLHRQHLLVLLPQLLRLPARPGADGRLLEAGRGAGRRQVALPRRLRPDRSASPRPTRRPSGSTSSTSTISTTAACTSIRASPTRRATARSRPSRPARCRNTPSRARGYRQAHLEGPDRGRLRHRRLARDRAPADGGADQGPARRQHLLPDARGQHADRQVHVIRRKLFAEKVMPHLRNMWPDYDDDNRFWMPPDWRNAQLPVGRVAERRPNDHPRRVTDSTSPRRRTVRCFEGRRGRERWSSCTAPAALTAEDPFLAALAEKLPRLRAAAARLRRQRGERRDAATCWISPCTPGTWSRRWGCKDPILVGHSMGGMIAAEMAAVAPHEVSRLGLIAPAGLWLDAHPIADLFANLPLRDAGAAVPRRRGRPAADDRRAATWRIPSSCRVPGHQCAPAGHGGQDPVSNSRAWAGAAALPDQGQDGDRLGPQDRLIPPVYGDAFKKAISKSKLVRIAKAGHAVGQEKPASVLKAIRDHF